MARFSHDPVYHIDSFFDLPIVFLERSMASMQRIEKARTQSDSVSTAYLADTVLSIVHSLYGKEGQPYKSNPSVFLPGYDREAAEIDEDSSLDPSIETIKILLKLIKGQRIHGLIIAHIAEFIPAWVEKYG